MNFEEKSVNKNIVYRIVKTKFAPMNIPKTCKFSKSLNIVVIERVSYFNIVLSGFSTNYHKQIANNKYIYFIGKNKLSINEILEKRYENTNN